MKRLRFGRWWSIVSKLEVIEGKQTNWSGLWWHPEYAGFSSAVISLSELRKFKGNVRLYVRKNKFFKRDADNNSPNYCFCLKDAYSDVFYTLEIEDEKRKEKGNTVMFIELHDRETGRPHIYNTEIIDFLFEDDDEGCVIRLKNFKDWAYSGCSVKVVEPYKLVAESLEKAGCLANYNPYFTTPKAGRRL